MIGGLFDDYHKPSDTADRIVYDKVARTAHFTAHIALQVAGAPGVPWSTVPLPTRRLPARDRRRPPGSFSCSCPGPCSTVTARAYPWESPESRPGEHTRDRNR